MEPRRGFSLDGRRCIRERMGEVNAAASHYDCISEAEPSLGKALMAENSGNGTALGGLSARLLLLTIVFVMVSEVLIFVPSVARDRLS